MNFIVEFITWTLMLYVIHRAIHVTPYLKFIHMDHHRYVNKNKTSWHWSNLFLFNDTWTSTFDLWITEVIPTLIFAWLFDAWWLAIFYYLWAALIQEIIEHNPKFNKYPFITSGQWHLIHHKNSKKNFGLFFPIWDKIFITEQKVK